MSGIKEYTRDKTRDGIDNKLLAECNHHTEKHHIETTHYKVSPDQAYPRSNAAHDGDGKEEHKQRNQHETDERERDGRQQKCQFLGSGKLRIIDVKLTRLLQLSPESVDLILFFSHNENVNHISDFKPAPHIRRKDICATRACVLVFKSGCICLISRQFRW